MSSTHLLCPQAAQQHLESVSLKVCLRQVNTTKMAGFAGNSVNVFQLFQDSQTLAIADGGTHSQ